MSKNENKVICFKVQSYFFNHYFCLKNYQGGQAAAEESAKFAKTHSMNF